jgi:LPPG:FO 2-phospho-L-lactate transferase
VGELTVVANTGDDAEVYGVHVAPDPDLLAYWLADEIDARGFGLRGDTWEVMAALERAGRPTWFRLGDRDLGMCLVRTEELRCGARLTHAHARVVEAMGVSSRVLPMTDDPAPTRVLAAGRWWDLQEFMIVNRAEGPVEDVDLAAVSTSGPTPEVLDAIASADVVVIGPSNPVISIGPILALPGMQEALVATSAPVVAVSPFVGGGVLKGPTAAFCDHAGIEKSAQGIADVYDEVIDGVVADEPVSGVKSLLVETRMDDVPSMAELARRTVDFAASLRR